MTEDLQRYAGLGPRVAITEADVRTVVNNGTDQVPTDNLAVFAQPCEFGQMIKAALAVPACISVTARRFQEAALPGAPEAHTVIAVAWSLLCQALNPGTFPAVP